MRNPLDENVVNDHKEKIKKLDSRHEELVKTEQEGRKRMRVINDEMSEAEKLIQAHNSELRQLSHSFQKMAQESQLNRRQAQHFQKELDEDIFEKQLREEIKTQPSFWDNLRPTLEKINEELTKGLNGISNKIDYEETVSLMKNRLTSGRGFNVDLVNASGFINQYDSAIRQICEKKLKKEKLSMRELQRTNSFVSDFLMHPAIEPMWNKL